jgi:acetyl esterase/lipase
MNKREFLKAAATMAVSTVVPRLFGESQPNRKTFVYKNAGGCEIKADVYGSDESVIKPAIILIHGGALIFGAREAPAGWLNPDTGYVVISIDYRLAPETKLPAIIEDLQDACRWVRERGPKLLHIDPERVAIAGESAGGYLTLMAGFSVNPPPRALVSLSGYGDITSTWYSRPSLHYSQKPPISRKEVYGMLGKGCVSAPSEKDEARWKFYVYCRQQGTWPKEVAGHDPDTESAWFRPYCPVRNVSAAYPPTLLIHGTADTDVPYEESVKMDEKLSEFKVRHEFVRVPGGSHCLEDDARDVREAAFRQAMNFVRAQIG